jgi:hypothetical protein
LTLEVGAPVVDGGGAALTVGGRDVPFTDVVALDEIDVFVLVVERTVAFVEATDGCESADVGAMFSEGARALTLG